MLKNNTIVPLQEFAAKKFYHNQIEPIIILVKNRAEAESLIIKAFNANPKWLYAEVLNYKIDEPIGEYGEFSVFHWLQELEQITGCD